MVVSLAMVLSVLGTALWEPLPAEAAGGATIDKVVTAHATSSATTVTSPAFTTSAPGELLMAFVSADGPASPTQTITSVTGGGLTWRLRQRTNAQRGTAEIWQAVAPNVLSSATVTATHAGSYQAAITVATFTGASLTVDGATRGASAASGAPGASLSTLRAGSWVWGVGNDWDDALARAVGAGQTKVDEYLASTGDTMWLQRQTSVSGAAGTSVTINDTAPTADRWNLSLVEIPAAAPDTDTTAPAISAVSSGTPTQTTATITWSTDEPSTTQVAYGTTAAYGSSTTLSSTLVTSHSQPVTGLTAGTTYHYQVMSRDASGNVAASVDATFSTSAQTSDTTPPAVSISAPTSNATVSGTVPVSATASDDTGVAGVQFTVDGAGLGAEDRAAPYSTPWDTTTAAPELTGSRPWRATPRGTPPPRPP